MFCVSIRSLSQVSGAHAASLCSGFEGGERTSRKATAACRRPRARRVRLGSLLLAGAGLAFGSMVQAQTAHLSGYRFTTNITPGTTSSMSPQDIAADGNGNVFVVYSGCVGDPCEPLTQVIEYSPSGGTYTSNVVIANIPNGGEAAPIVVDQSDNIYILAFGNDFVGLLKYTLSGGNYVQSVIPRPANTNGPTSLLVDTHGNIYATYEESDTVYEFTPSGGGYTTTSIPIPSPPSFNQFEELDLLAVDAAGDLYINGLVYVDPDNETILVEEVPSVGGYTQVYTPGYDPMIVNDVAGNLYFNPLPTSVSTNQRPTIAADTSGILYTIWGVIWKSTTYPASSSGDNFGNVAVGASSWYSGNSAAYSDILIASIFTFDSPGTLGGITVAGVYNGNTGYEFPQPAGSCQIGTAYAAGQTCDVDVAFAPTTVGSRFGAVYLTNSSNSVLATGYVQGRGVAPAAVIYPGVQSVLFSAASNGLGQPAGLALDGVGDIFIADSANNQVVAQANGGPTQVVIANGPSNGLSGPTGVAVDGSGSVLIADTGSDRVVKETLYQDWGSANLGQSSPLYTQTVVAGSLVQPQGVAVDGAGNVYIADTGNNRILLETPAASGYTQTVLIDSGLSNPTGIAVDGSGDLFIANNGAGEVVEETLSGGIYTPSVVASGLNLPQGVSLDPAGNVYIADSGNNRALLEQWDGSGYTQTVIASGLNNPQAFFLNSNISNTSWGMGREYIADTGNQRVLELDLIDTQALNFATTPVGVTSSPQTLTLVNIGNAPLLFTVPSTGSNPSLAANSGSYFNSASAFTLTGGDCPAVSAGASEPTTLAAGASCQMSLSFTPIALNPPQGNVEGDILSIADNSLNSVYGNPPTQTTMLVGTATSPVPATLSSPTPGTKLAGTNITFSWTPGEGITHYWLNLGTAASGVNAKNIYSGSSITATSVTISGLPNNDETIYATLYSLINGAWQPIVYTYSAFGNGNATLLTPTAATKLTAGTTFTWSAGSGVAAYWLNVGTANAGANAKNIYSSGSIMTLSKTVTGIPTYGETLYVTLYSEIAGVYQPIVYTYTASGSPVAAALTTPTPSTKLASPSVTFTWSGSEGVTYYWFNLGTTTSGANSKNLYSGSSTTLTSVTASGLPTNGETIYATLYSYIAGVWQPTIYTYTASGSPTPAVLTTPTPTTQLTSSTVTFTWSPGSGVTYFWLNLGTASSGANSKNIYSGSSTTATSVTVSGLPTNGETLHATLYSYIGGAWQPTVYTYTAQ